MSNLWLYLLFSSAFLSITLFEFLVIFTLIYFSKRPLRGILLKPLSLYALSVFTSTLIYAPYLLPKAIERGPFLLLYGLGKSVKRDKELLERLNHLLISFGLFLIPVVLFKFYKTGIPAPLWGGWFEVGAFYSFFSLSSLSLFFERKKLKYFILFFVFTFFVFFSMRRSCIFGLTLTLLLLGFLVKGKVKTSYIILTLTPILTALVITPFLLSLKDQRFKTLFEVVEGRRKFNEEALNTILTNRWFILKEGLKVLQRDIKERRLIPLLLGHGLNAGKRLHSPFGGYYESFLLFSEFIEKGLVGVIALTWLYLTYYLHLFRRRIKSLLEIPFLLIPSVVFLGALFTTFWDALLPLYLLSFGMVEEEEEEGHGGHYTGGGGEVKG